VNEREMRVMSKLFCLQAIEFLVAGGAFEWRDDEKEDDEDNPREGREHYIKAIKTDRKYVEKPKILVLKSPSQGA
jgi:hypothetical protein